MKEEEKSLKYDSSAKIWLRNANAALLKKDYMRARFLYSKITDKELNKDISNKYINEAKLMLKEFYFEN